MSAAYTPRLSWEAAFLDALAKSKLIKRSAHVAGITTGAVYGLRDRNEAFARECKRVMQCDKDTKRAPAPTPWKRVFLETHAETSNVTASAKKADITANEVCKLRREDNEFTTQWQAALFEGYTNLEMELLGYLRNPKSERKMDVTHAPHLLVAHKESHSKEQALRAHVSAAEIRASIERKVEVSRNTMMDHEIRTDLYVAASPGLRASHVKGYTQKERDAWPYAKNRRNTASGSEAACPTGNLGSGHFCKRRVSLAAQHIFRPAYLGPTAGTNRSIRSTARRSTKPFGRNRRRNNNSGTDYELSYSVYRFLCTFRSAVSIRRPSPKEFFYNHAVVKTDLLQNLCIENEASAPPAVPVDGQSWLISAGATGEWSGKEGMIASWQTGVWLYRFPHHGLRVFVKSTKQMIHFNDDWRRAEAPQEPEGRDVFDSEARAAFTLLIEALKNAGIFPESG